MLKTQVRSNDIDLTLGRGAGYFGCTRLRSGFYPTRSMGSTVKATLEAGYHFYREPGYTIRAGAFADYLAATETEDSESKVERIYTFGLSIAWCFQPGFPAIE